MANTRTTKRTTPPKPRVPPPPVRYLEGGVVEWDIDGTTYTLKDLTFGALSELTTQNTAAADLMLDYTDELVEQQPTTKGRSKAAKAATTTDARERIQRLNDLNKRSREFMVGWYDLLFADACVGGRPFPATKAPTWISSAEFRLKLLNHLATPLPPGVL